MQPRQPDPEKLALDGVSSGGARLRRHSVCVVDRLCRGRDTKVDRSFAMMAAAS
jgi:hypothetical protein